MQNILDAIEPVDTSLTPQIQAHLNDLTHPTRSLGRLEETALHWPST